MAPPRLCCSLIVSCKLASMWFLLFSRVWLFATPRTVACQASLSFTVSQSLLIFMSTELMMPSSQLVLYCPLLLLPSIFPSIRIFSNEGALCIRWLKYWNFSFSISPSDEYSGLISFRIDWFDFLAVQGTLKSLLQRHSAKASVFFISFSALSFLYGPTLTSTYDYCKNYSFDYMALCQQSDVSAFWYTV